VLQPFALQVWVVPQSATYEFTLAGAAGGSASQYTPAGGGGAVLSARVRLAQSDLVYLVVGQLGLNAAFGGGGGAVVPIAALHLQLRSPLDAGGKCRTLCATAARLECRTGGGSYVFTDDAAFPVNTPFLVAGE
jgi:hypothetical protein